MNKTKLKNLKFYNATLPIISEVLSRTDWVFYGENNLYPQYLIEQYNNSAIHKSIVQSKVAQICGDGIYSTDEPMAVVNLINNKENVGDVFAKCALDLVLFGGYALHIIHKKDRSQGIAEIYHLDFSRIRSGKINPETGEVEEYYYCNDWSNTRKHKPEVYPVFDMNTDEPSQILYVKSYQPSNDYYPAPDYSGGLMAIDISIEIQNFHKQNLKQGMLPSLFISFNSGIPPEEEQEIMTRALEESYGGTDNAGRAVISFNESKEQAPEITAIQPNQTDSYYQQIYEDIIRSILSAHRVSSGELYGVSQGGKLGSANEILEHSEYFRNMVIKSYINELLPTFDKLVSMKYQKPIRFEIKPLTILETIKDDNQPIE